MNSVPELIGRKGALFALDLNKHKQELAARIAGSSFLVIGGAGSIGQAVVKILFTWKAKTLHVVDISENNLVELVRDLRSSAGYLVADFQTLPLDCGSREFEAFYKAAAPYDYIFNLSALKHVRSEKDVYSLMRMIKVNILNTELTLEMARQSRSKKYFCVSTDKAANPVNMMGASKRIMEKFLMQKSLQLPISTARFANVAFSDGSLLHGFTQRLLKQQPLSAPDDVRRYFITQQEAGELCVLSCLLGENRDIFFPKLAQQLDLLSFSNIAERYLRQMGFEPHLCDSEEEARAEMHTLVKQRKWPCYFFKSDTTGEKDYEEFFMESEQLDLERFHAIGIIKNQAPAINDKELAYFKKEIRKIGEQPRWHKEEIIKLFQAMLPEFHHLETNKYLDQRM